jgi:hypothetical protein
MAALYRLDVLVRGNSTISQDDAVKWTKNWVNDRQEADNNKDEDGNYIKEYYADLYDSRTNKGWKVFSDVATKNRSIKNEYICENDEVIKGVIYTLPFSDDVVALKKEIEALKIEIEFLKAQIYEETQNNEVKIIV